MTIKDKDMFMNLLNNKTEQELKADYKNKGEEYQRDIVESNADWARRESQEYALLKVFGDIIDLFKSPNIENLNFKPIVILPNPNNTDKRKVRTTNKPCPTN